MPKNKKKVRALIVDDHPLFRDGLVELINRQRDLASCGHAGTVAEATAALDALKPDFILLDLRLGGGDALEFIKSCKARTPAVAILVLSQFDEALYAGRVLRAGADGYIMKEEATEEVLVAIRTILAGGLYVSRKMSVIVLQKLLGKDLPLPAVGVESFSDRELQVFQLLGSGSGTRQIAESLHLSAKTIETHRENLKRKLHLTNGSELVHQAKAWMQRVYSPRVGGGAEP